MLLAAVIATLEIKERKKKVKETRSKELFFYGRQRKR
jgi:hypothetical protein